MVNLDKTIADLAAIEADASLDKDLNLCARVEALDQIDFVLEIVRLRGRRDDLESLGQRATAQRQRLEQVNERLFEHARARIRSGKHGPRQHRAWFGQFTDYSPRQLGRPHTGYDALDALVDGTLHVDRAPQATRAPAPEMVHLEPTPARVVLEMVDRLHLQPEDVFYDLGSGLGQVAILVHLLSGIRTLGIEVEPAYVELACDRAWVLGLSEVRFVNEDARAADYSRGTVFYLFTPFMGQMLQAVLDRLHKEAQTRPIRVCSYGPCTPHVAQQPWLRSVGPGADHEFKLAVFASI